MRQGAQGWCTGMTLRDGMGREVRGRIRMGKTCTPMADSCECMAKTTTILSSNSVQFSHSVMSDSVTPWTAARQASLFITNFWSPPKPMSIESVIPSNHLILCVPLPPPAFNLSQHQSLFQWVSFSIRWPKSWHFSFSISPSNDYSGIISFRMDWLDLLAVQGTLKSLLQHHSSKASILWHSTLFIVQLSHPYMTTGKTVALTTFVGKVMSVLF